LADACLTRTKHHQEYPVSLVENNPEPGLKTVVVRDAEPAGSDNRFLKVRFPRWAGAF